MECVHDGAEGEFFGALHEHRVQAVSLVEIGLTWLRYLPSLVGVLGIPNPKMVGVGVGTVFGRRLCPFLARRRRRSFLRRPQRRRRAFCSSLCRCRAFCSKTCIWCAISILFRQEGVAIFSPSASSPRRLRSCSTHGIAHASPLSRPLHNQVSRANYDYVVRVRFSYVCIVLVGY